MEKSVFVKCEPAWPLDTEEEPSNFDSNELLSEKIHLKEEIKSELAEPGQVQVNTFQMKSRLADFQLPKECSSSDSSQRARRSRLEKPLEESDIEYPNFSLSISSSIYKSFVDVKDEISMEEHKDGQLEPCSKEDDNVERVGVLTRGRVGTFDSRCKILKTASQLVCSVPPNNVYNHQRLSHSRGTPRDRKEYNTALSLKLSNEGQISPKYSRTHCGERLYSCDICAKQFGRKSNLSRHMLTHGDADDRPHCCNVCGRKFCRKHDLRKHTIIHTGEYPQYCNECGKYFREKCGLNGHMLTNTNVRPYRCTICGKTFGRQSNLTRHMLTHAKDRLHLCKACDKSFNDRYDLRAHMNFHSAVSPHSGN